MPVSHVECHARKGCPGARGLSNDPGPEAGLVHFVAYANDALRGTVHMCRMSYWFSGESVLSVGLPRLMPMSTRGSQVDARRSLDLLHSEGPAVLLVEEAAHERSVMEADGARAQRVARDANAGPTQADLKAHIHRLVWDQMAPGARGLRSQADVWPDCASP